jgi:hypothetical protein
MRLLSYNGKRFVLVVCLVVLVFSAANRYLEWGFLGRFGGALPSFVVLVVIVLTAMWGDEMHEKGRQQMAAQREADAAAERNRDKSHDAEDLVKLRKAIGLPPNKSLGLTRER